MELGEARFHFSEVDQSKYEAVLAQDLEPGDVILTHVVVEARVQSVVSRSETGRFLDLEVHYHHPIPVNQQGKQNFCSPLPVWRRKTNAE